MKNVLAVLLALILSGCSSVDIATYKNTQPTLSIEDYFNGKTVASGVFQDRFGNVRRRFTVDIVGTWVPETRTLTLVEDFVYDDGEVEQRIWTIIKQEDGTYRGQAKNVVGEAVGTAAGNAFNFRYKFDLAVGNAIWRVAFDDWMFLQPDGRILFNKAQIRRWGIWLGDVYIFFDKVD
jgi:hypothetical protein